MVKHFVLPYDSIFSLANGSAVRSFSPELLLLAFLAQAGLASPFRAACRADSRGADGPIASEQVRITAGWRQLHGGGIAGAPYPDPPGALPIDVSQDNDGFDTEHSPLLSLVTAAPLARLAAPPRPRIRLQLALASAHSIPRLSEYLLGASLWYVACRLCGNAGGFLALTLYCFLPR